MYSLLPAMSGANPEMLIQTLHDMKQCYPREKLRHHLDRFWKMLQKSITVQLEGKRQVEKELKMQFDWFIDTVPEVIERVELAKQHCKQEGRVEGELQALRRTVLKAVQMRFPMLMDFAQIQVEKFTAPDHLDSLALHIMLAPDEATVIHLLTEKRG